MILKYSDKPFCPNLEYINYEFLYIFTNPSAWAGYDTRSIFKQNLTDLNSKFSFSSTSSLVKAEEPSLPLLFTHSWREDNWIHIFPKGISASMEVPVV